MAQNQNNKSVNIDPAIHKTLKFIAVLTDQDVKDIVDKAADEYISKNYPAIKDKLKALAV